MKPIHEAVARVAARWPDRPAVAGTDGGSLTYRDLDGAANAWARRLVGQGVRPGGIVPVVAQRSVGLPVLLLAILKCGAAYAVVDERWPEARIGAVLTGLGAPLAAVAPEHVAMVRRSGLAVWSPPPLADPDLAHTDLADAEGLPDVDPDAPACVFFTSGTTGASKCVVSPHRATTRLFAADGPMAFGPGRAMPLTSSLSWDAASFELWGMLTTGGTSVVVAEPYVMPHVVADLVARHGVDTMWLTASLFNLLVVEDVDCLAGLDAVWVGGERLSPPHVRDFLLRFPDAELHNGYGPVESCVFATTHRVTLADCTAEHGIPIGLPVPGTAVLVLDGDRVCGPDEPGELCLTGTGLAVGYLGDEALTSARFPQITVAGATVRVYRTGDLGVRDVAGVVHYLGRADRQIKLRGHRIELDGIEAEAAAAAPLSACTAVAVTDPAGFGGVDKVALFYVTDVAVDPADGDPLRLRELLAARLPGYAVPDVVVALDRLPLTANGKVDSNALRARLDDRQGVGAPRIV